MQEICESPQRLIEDAENAILQYGTSTKPRNALLARIIADETVTFASEKLCEEDLQSAMRNLPLLAIPELLVLRARHRNLTIPSDKISAVGILEDVTFRLVPPFLFGFAPDAALGRQLLLAAGLWINMHIGALRVRSAAHGNLLFIPSLSILVNSDEVVGVANTELNMFTGRPMDRKIQTDVFSLEESTNSVTVKNLGDRVAIHVATLAPGSSLESYRESTCILSVCAQDSHSDTHASLHAVQETMPRQDTHVPATPSAVSEGSLSRKGNSARNDTRADGVLSCLETDGRSQLGRETVEHALSANNERMPARDETSPTATADANFAQREGIRKDPQEDAVYEPHLNATPDDRVKSMVNEESARLAADALSRNAQLKENIVLLEASVSSIVQENKLLQEKAYRLMQEKLEQEELRRQLLLENTKLEQDATRALLSEVTSAVSTPEPETNAVSRSGAQGSIRRISRLDNETALLMMEKEMLAREKAVFEKEKRMLERERRAFLESRHAVEASSLLRNSGELTNGETAGLSSAAPDIGYEPLSSPVNNTADALHSANARPTATTVNMASTVLAASPTANAVPPAAKTTTSVQPAANVAGTIASSAVYAAKQKAMTEEIRRCREELADLGWTTGLIPHGERSADDTGSVYVANLSQFARPARNDHYPRTSPATNDVIRKIPTRTASDSHYPNCCGAGSVQESPSRRASLTYTSQPWMPHPGFGGTQQPAMELSCAAQVRNDVPMLCGDMSRRSSVASRASDVSRLAGASQQSSYVAAGGIPRCEPNSLARATDGTLSRMTWPEDRSGMLIPVDLGNSRSAVV